MSNDESLDRWTAQRLVAFLAETERNEEERGHRTWDFGRQTSDDRLRTSDIRCGCPRSEVGRLEAFSRPDMCELRVGGFKWVRFLGRIPIEG